jgi:two-component system chemotaxis response regulator CheB
MEKSRINNDFKVVMIGGSAGSLQVLMQLLPQLPSPLHYAIVIVLHRKNTEDNTLEELIALKATAGVQNIEDKVVVEPGYIYVAPAGYHLLFESNFAISLDISEKINFSIPSIDVSFQSASEAFKSNAVGILLSGANSDGTAGLVSIKNQGGITVVQDPNTAEIDFMPKNAVKKALPDQVLSIEEISNFLVKINY